MLILYTGEHFLYLLKNDFTSYHANTLVIS